MDARLRGLLTGGQIREATGLCSEDLGLEPDEWHHNWFREGGRKFGAKLAFFEPKRVWTQYRGHLLACSAADNACKCWKGARGRPLSGARRVVKQVWIARQAGYRAGVTFARNNPPERIRVCPSCGTPMQREWLREHLAAVHPGGRRIYIPRMSAEKPPVSTDEERLDEDPERLAERRTSASTDRSRADDEERRKENVPDRIFGASLVWEQIDGDRGNYARPTYAIYWRGGGIEVGRRRSKNNHSWRIFLVNGVGWKVKKLDRGGERPNLERALAIGEEWLRRNKPGVFEANRHRRGA